MAALPRNRAAADDVIDAMVLALTAAQGERTELLSIPETADYDELGVRMEMVVARVQSKRKNGC